MGDVARVLRRMAEVHFRKGQSGDGERTKALAEKMRRDIQGEEYDEENDTEEGYNLLVACYYR